MLVCTFTLQRDYKGETGRDGGFHFLVENKFLYLFGVIGQIPEVITLP